MAEYIEREALLEKRYNANDIANLPFENMVVDVRDIEEAPTANVVEVVRCKDCVWRIEIPNGTEFKGIKPKYCGLKQELTGENDYCSKGAKMDGKADNNESKT